MTCDDDAWLKDNAIQKEMGFRIKPAFTCFQALLENSIETSIHGMYLKVSSI